MKNRNEKQQDLDKLKTELAKVSTVILSTFQGITVEDDTKLRRAVQAAGGKYKVVKNTLAERSGATHRHSPERFAAQRGGNGKRGYQGKQVWVRRGQRSTGSRSGPVSSISRIERRRKSHVESRYDPGRNQGADAAGSVRPR